MAKLTTAQRKRLPDRAFALPEERRFPIPDKSHARNALARASQGYASPEQVAIIRRAIHRRFPEMLIKALNNKRS